MTTTVADEFKDYFDSLTATADICVALGTVFDFDTNLFIGVEPESDECLSIYTYGGAPPNKDGSRQEPSVQVRFKTSTRRKVLSVMQSIINTLHENDNVCASSPGRVFANQSAPMIIGVREGGEFVVSIANFTVKHIKF